MGNNHPYVKNICSTCSFPDDKTEKNYYSDSKINNVNATPLIINNNYLNITNIQSSDKEDNNIENNLKKSYSLVNKEVQLLQYNDGSTYIGEVNKGLKEGLGIFKSDKTLYKGYLINDAYSGFGILENNKGLTYEGLFINSKKELYGIQYSNEKNYYYEGEWKNNNKTGVGKEKLLDESYYEGEFYNGKKHGWGIYTMSTGKNYEGEFKDGLINGYGQIKSESGDYYNGYWEDNSYNGFGILKKHNVIFKGFFKKDLKFGFGIKYYVKESENDEDSNIILVGKWIENNLEGFSLGIGKDNQEVCKIFRYTNNVLSSTIKDYDKIQEKLRTNLECFKLKKFYEEITK